MFKRWANELSLMLAANKIITFENREAYSYGIELFLFKGTLYLFVAILSLISHSFIPSALFVISYMLLRQYSGGYHCKTAEMCLIVSVFIYLLFLMIYNLDYAITRTFLVGLSVIALLPIAIFSPVENINNPLTTDEKKKYRIIAIAAGIVLAAIAGLTYFYNIKCIFYSVSYALAADAVLIIIGKGGNRNEKADYESYGSNG